MVKLNFGYIIVRIVRIIGLGAILTSVLLSCNDDVRLHYKEVNGDGWLSSDTINLKIDSISCPGIYKLSVGVRTSSARPYPYSQIVLEMRQNWLSQNKIFVDTIHCDLSAKDGEMQGTGVSVYSYIFAVDSLQLNAGDSAKVSIRHLMRRSPLPGIYNIGILLEKEH